MACAADCSAFDLAGGETGCLLVHGFTGTPFEMRYLGEELHRRGHTVRAVLLPGHATLGPELLTAGWRDWYGAAKEGLDVLRTRCGDVFAVGLSMGALLALKLAADQPEAVSGIAVLAPALALTDPRPRRYAPLARAVLRFLPRSWQTMPKSSSDILDPEARTRHPRFPVPLRGLAELFTLQAQVRALLPRVRCPTLILQGRHDHTCPVENAALVRREIAAARVRLSILENSAHVITVDREKERVAAEIAAFIAEVTAEAAPRPSPRSSG